MSVIDHFAAQVVGASPDTVVAIKRAEAQAREFLERLSETAPWTSGTASRAARIQAGLVSVLAVPGGRLMRALRVQQSAWDHTAEPLRSALERVDRLVAAASEICAVVSDLPALREQLGQLEECFAPVVPRAWRQLVVERGLTVDALDLLLSAEEISAAMARIGHVAERLEAWSSELAGWLSESLHEGDSAVHRNTSMPAAGDLEERYELLLNLSAAERTPQQEVTAINIRTLASQQIGSAVKLARIRAGDALFELAASFSRATGPALSSEEIDTYRAALGNYCRIVMRRQQHA